MASNDSTNTAYCRDVGLTTVVLRAVDTFGNRSGAVCKTAVRIVQTASRPLKRACPGPGCVLADAGSARCDSARFHLGEVRPGVAAFGSDA